MDVALLVLAIAAAAVGAGFAAGEPTGLLAWDVVLRAAVAALFVLGVAVAPHWVAVSTATLAVAFIGRSVWLIPAGLGLVLAIVAGLIGDDNRWVSPRVLRAVAAAATVQALLRLPAVGFFGLPSIIAGVAIAAALMLGYRNTSGVPRRLVRWGAGVSALALVAAVVVGGIVILGARDDVEQGIEAARDGLSAARGGEPEAVVASLEEAADALARAERRTDSIWTQPLRLVPVAAQHRHAVTLATEQGSAIARQASKATIEADISSITMAAGSVDLSALAAMETDLVETVALLESGVVALTEARSPWLVSPVADRMESLTEEMRSVLPEARVAAAAAKVVPAMLGRDAPRRYLVAFGSPAESREFGGVVGSWALLEFDDGDVRQIEASRISDLYDLSRANAPLGPLGYPEWYVYRAVPEYWPQNITSSPQPAIVTSAVLELLAGLGGGAIDGFVYVDGFALGALLNITGPVQVEGVDQRLNPTNVVDFLFDGQYRLDDRDEVKDDFTAIFAAAFEGLLDRQLPGPEQLGRILGPVARQGRLQVMTIDDAENAFLRSIKLQRTFGASSEAADSFAVVQANGSASKLDLYLQRDVEYSVSVDDAGMLTGSASVTLRSEVPDDAPAYALGSSLAGHNVSYLSLYSPHEMEGVTIDGVSVEFLRTEEFGYHRYEVTVELPANEQRVVRYEFTGQVDPARDYTVSVWHQPLVNNDAVQVAYDGPEGADSVAFELIEDTIVDFDE